MEHETTTEIESIDIASEDMITILAEVAEYHATNGSVGVPTVVVLGTGPRRMAVPESQEPDPTRIKFDGTLLNEGGSVVDELPLHGELVSVNIV